MTTISKDKEVKSDRPANPPNLQLTERVIRINSAICRAEAIRKDELQEQFPEIPEAVFDRIERYLFYNGFHARPRQQRELHPKKGSLKTYLSSEVLGVQLHYAFFKDPVPAPKFSQDNNYRTWSYMQHKFNETTSVLRYKNNARQIPGVNFLTQADLWEQYAPNKRLNQPALNIDNIPKLMAHEFIANPPEHIGKQQPKVPLHLKSWIDWQVRLPRQLDYTADLDELDYSQFFEEQLSTVSLPVSTQPDDFFAHHKSITDFFFFEEDEDNETILPGETNRQSPQLFSGSSLFAKYVAYIAAYRKRTHTKQYGITSFSVITHTTTPLRGKWIIRQVAPILLKKPFNIHPNFIRISDRVTSAKCGHNPYHPQYRYLNLAGQEVQVLPR